MPDRILKAGSRSIYAWGIINFLLSSLILTIVIFGFGNSPLLTMVFEESEVVKLSAGVILALNCLTILYNSYAIALSVLVIFVVRFCLLQRQQWAFWTLFITMGFVEVFAFIASALVGNVRWQVNLALSVLYLVGIGLSGYSLLRTRWHIRA